MTCRPKDYAERGLHRTVRPPSRCPACRAEGSLDAHDYYPRDTTDDDGQVLKILVRRFCWRRCHATVSCLPRFAQPYRLVNSDTIDAYFNGRRDGHGIPRNAARVSRHSPQNSALRYRATREGGAR